MSQQRPTRQQVKILKALADGNESLYHRAHVRTRTVMSCAGWVTVERPTYRDVITPVGLAAIAGH